MWAAAEGHVEVIQALVDGGADINKLSAYQKFIEPDEDKMQGGFVYPIIPKGRMSALHFAARNGHVEATQMLINLGADLNIVDEEGSTPAMLAILNGHYELASVLINAGTDVNIQDKFGRTVLFIATDMHTLDASPRPGPKPYGELNSLDIVRLALDKGADPNLALTNYLPQPTALDFSNPMLGDGASPLFRAAMSGDIEIIHMLLEAGADPYLRTAEYAPGQYQRESATNLTNVVMAAAGLSWRPSISRGRVSDAIATLELFLEEYDIDINAVNKSGATALHGAVMRGSPEIVEFLAQNGADFTLLARAFYDLEGFYADDFYLSPLDLAMGIIELRLEPNPAVEAVLRRYMTQSDFDDIARIKANLAQEASQEQQL
jgi:ankyrin repeat protein